MKIKELLMANSLVEKIRIDEKKPAPSKKGKSASRDPKSTRVGIVTPRIGAGAEGQFEDSTIDLNLIERAYYSEAYIRRAIDKIAGLMFKSGWGFVSKNPEALTYVKTRLKLIEESTSTSTEELLRELGLNYILFSNAPVIKTRGTENLAGLNASGYYGGEPISGIFAAPPTGFRVARDGFGNPINYEISAGGGQGTEFKIEDVSHMTYHKPTGRAYGVPFIQNVLDDVLILRQIEENVARLVYRNLFPLQTYTVGDTTPGYEATDEEIEEVIASLESMPVDGMVVLSERHKIETVSNNNAVLDANNYLKYFRQRVFTGLAMSESVMGIGDTTNKSTSDNQSSDLNDLVKDFQQSFSAEIQKEIINEILFEGGYDPTMNEEDEVQFIFTEIEQGAKMARENHITQLWNNNLISHTEARISIGKDPVDDLSDFYISLIKGTSSNDTENKAVDNKDQPENQHGKQDSPKDQKNSKKATDPLTEAKELVNLDISRNIKEKSNKYSLLLESLSNGIKNTFEETKDIDKIKLLIEKSSIMKLSYISEKESNEKELRFITQDLIYRIENIKNDKNIIDILELFENKVYRYIDREIKRKEKGGSR